LIRFIENHDEKRAITTFGLEESLAAATIALCLPGGRLVHYGQQLGYEKKLPVQLRRWSQLEKTNEEVQNFYIQLTKIIHSSITESNLWNIGRAYKENTPGPENPMISYYWNLNRNINYIVVNFSAQDVECVLDLSTHRQDIDYKVSSLLSRNCNSENIELNDSKIHLSFGQWGIQILKLSY
jgi:hypothetical protein